LGRGQVVQQTVDFVAAVLGDAQKVTEGELFAVDLNLERGELLLDLFAHSVEGEDVVLGHGGPFINEMSDIKV
jgi:hypothetical protein